MEEIWRPIPGHEMYQVSSSGRVKSVRTQRLLRPACGRDNPYLSFRPSVNGRQTTLYVHLAVLLAFHGPRPFGMEALHRDGNEKHNSASNLRWGTRRENAADRVTHGTVLTGQKNPNAKMTEASVLEARRLREQGLSFKKIAAAIGVSTMTAFRAISGRSWAHIKEHA